MKNKKTLGVGIVGCSFISRRHSSGRNSRGKLTCMACNTPGHIALYHGEVCEACYKPYQINPDYTATAGGRRTDNRIQSSSTLALKDRCIAAMIKHGLSQHQFAARIGVDKSGFNYWMGGKYAALGQRNMAVKIARGLNQYERRMKKAAEVAA